ncbi:MAG: DUF1648 domain-containing protein [Flammeovirgaceae bacterium]|nr:DUF1648 domain-containing protein [Flammeovirgaceae bacterium]
MSRPKMKIELTRLDWGLEIIGLAGVISMITISLINYQNLPEIIPIHFNALGEPDGYSDKAVLWIVVACALGLYILLTILQNYPHKFNYLIDITKENGERQYRNAILMIRTIKTVITINFLYLTYATIQVSIGKLSGLGTYSLAIFLVTILGSISLFGYRSYKLS